MHFCSIERFNRRRIAAPMLIAALCLIASASQASAATYDIRWDDEGYIARIGALRDVNKRPMYYEQLRKVFGKPRVARRYKTYCLLRWKSLGLEATVASFGVSNRTCGRRSGKVLQSASIRGPRAAIWSVEGQVVLATPADALESAFPDGFYDTIYDERAYVLQEAYFGFGSDDGYQPTSWAEMNDDGEVRRVSFWIGGAGD